MTYLCDSFGKMVRAVVAVLLLAVSLPVVSADLGYLLLSDGSQPSDVIHSELESVLVGLPNNIERDSERAVFLLQILGRQVRATMAYTSVAAA